MFGYLISKNIWYVYVITLTDLSEKCIQYSYCPYDPGISHVEDHQEQFFNDIQSIRR